MAAKGAQVQASQWKAERGDVERQHVKFRQEAGNGSWQWHNEDIGDACTDLIERNELLHLGAQVESAIKADQSLAEPLKAGSVFEKQREEQQQREGYANDATDGGRRLVAGARQTRRRSGGVVA